MNTQSISISGSPARIPKDSRLVELKPLNFAFRIAQWALAGTVATAVIISGIWGATTPEMGQFLSALLWGAGLLFFAIAINANMRRVLPQIATGLVLPVLAILGSTVAEEFSVLGAAMVAAWLATWIVRRG